MISDDYNKNFTTKALLVFSKVNAGVYNTLVVIIVNNMKMILFIRDLSITS